MFRYQLFEPIRLLLPVSMTLFLLPIFIPQLLTYAVLPVFYFFGSYFLLLNFPIIAELLHSKPLYIEDLVLTQGGVMDDTFHRWYNITMNFILAVLVAASSDYVIFRGIMDKPFAEILALIGGVLSLYFNAQHTAGRVLITFCHCMKEREEVKRRRPEIELTRQE